MLFLLSGKMHGQSDTLVQPVKFDSIRFVNGSRQAAKIIEIGEKYVKYKNPLTPEGPIFSVRRKDVAGFILKDGCIDLKQQGFENCVQDPTFGVLKDPDLKRKSIQVDLFQIFNKHLQINVDFIFKNKKKGIGFFGNIGLSDPYDLETYERLETKAFLAGGYYKKAYAGIDYRIFPSAHKKVTYFCSLGLDFGKAYFQRTIIYPDTYINTQFIGRHEKTFTYDALYIGYRFNNGFVWRIEKNFICQPSVTIGVSQYNYDDPDKLEERKNSFLPKFSVGLLFGFAF